MKLSVCIPTFNRAEFLEETIRSIYAESVGYEVEVSVVDNCSTDNTKEVISKLQEEFSSLVFNVNPENIGPDLNYMACVEKSTGDYCWLMGSDDHANVESIKKIFSVITELSPDILLFDRENYDLEMKKVMGNHKFLNSAERIVVNTLNENEVDDYLSKMNDLGGIFSYLSSIVVKRSCWDKTKVIPDHIGTAYLHSSRIFLMMKNGAKLVYEPFSVVKNRMGNDFFAGNGYVKRILIDLNYFPLVIDIFEGKMQRIFLKHLNHHVASTRTLIAYKFWAIHYQGRDGAKALIKGYIERPINWGFLGFRKIILKLIPAGVLSFLYFQIYLKFIKKKSEV